MLHSVEDVRHLFHCDVDVDFLQSFSVGLAWEYHVLFEELKGDDRLPEEIKNTEFAIRRSNCAIRALSRSCQKHGIPLHQWRLACNGQMKVLAQMGRVLLLLEPMSELPHKPVASNYKTALANSFGVSRQLELDLGDRPLRKFDPSGEVLAVLLHGASGAAFTKRDKALGGLMLAVPDDRYENWIARFDLHGMAMFGAKSDAAQRTPPQDVRSTQRDEVVVTPKRKTRNVGILK